MKLGTIEVIFERLQARSEKVILWDGGREITSRDILDHMNMIRERLKDGGVGAASIVGFKGDYGMAAIATFLALMELKAIAVPFSKNSSPELQELFKEANIEFWFDAEKIHVEPLRRPEPTDHPLVSKLREALHPGLIIFTSGSSGRPKAILHDLECVASKFMSPRRGWRMVLFLMIDHFGGFNTLLASLAYDSIGICIKSRLPFDVCSAISDARAELLPTTPTFLSILIASGVWRKFDLSSIKLVTYGAEPMPESVLRKLPEVFPNAKFKQTYGLSELGVLQSVSPSDGSLWLRVGGEGFATRVVNDVLHIKSSSSMLGYLNAASPIDAEGWMNTGDIVEQKDGLIKIIARQSDVINVGGQKVFPMEVEAVLLEIPQVTEASVFSIKHPVLGQAVGARLTLIKDVDSLEIMQIIKVYCKQHLQKYKIPMRFEVINLEQHTSDRGKKIRR